MNPIAPDNKTILHEQLYYEYKGLVKLKQEKSEVTRFHNFALYNNLSGVGPTVQITELLKMYSII